MLQATTKNKQTNRGKHYSAAIGLTRNFYIYIHTKEKAYKHENMYTKNAKHLRIKCKKKKTNNKQILSKYTSDFF